MNTSIKRYASNTAIRYFKFWIKLLGKRRGAQFSARLAEQLSPIITIETKHGSIQFYCPSEIAFWRGETLLTKEPETIEWIDNFNKESVFWDIGANIGMYSLYAALRPQIQVLAFEPASANYYLLNKNIEINKMDNRIFSFCLAFNDVTLIERLNCTTTEVGGALSSFAATTDWQGKPFSPIFKQGMIGFKIDEFIERFNPPFPNHIKIDVDGIEDKIINGAQKTISDNRLSSLLLELDTDQKDYCQGVIGYLKRAGMKLLSVKHAPMLDGSKFASVYNHIFVRSQS
jgi:FkbM family methyltransferase